MKSPFLQARFTSLLAAGVLLGVTSLGSAAIDPTPTAGSGVRLTTKDDYKDASWGKLKGTGVHAADGKQLGTVRDVVLDARSGEPQFVIVGGGGFVGLGAHLRVLPFAALIRDPNGHDFLTRLQHVDWELLPELEKADIDEGRLALTTDNRRRLTRLREQPWAQAFEGLASDDNASAGRYVFASELVGKGLYGEGEKVGEVEDLAIDARGGPALAVVQIDADYVGAKHEYLVPLSALQAAAGKSDRVHTTLPARDFREAAGVRIEDADRDQSRWARLQDRRHDDRTVRETERRAVTEPDNRRVVRSPAPTGFPSSYRANDGARTAAALDDAARAIRDHWEHDSDLRAYTLRANPDGGRIRLEGVLPTQRLANQAEDIARRVTTGIAIENEIRVDTRTR